MIELCILDYVGSSPYLDVDEDIFYIKFMDEISFFDLDALIDQGIMRLTGALESELV